jgi:tRNA 2-selenouridine synthase
MNNCASENLSFYSSLFQQQELFLVDVRSPGEFQNGHIPNAVNIPLFTDEQRAIVGVTYKQEGKKAAIEKGLSLISLSSFVDKIKELRVPKKLVLYCARGGMRSQAMGWLFGLLEHEVTLLPGGYKSFRAFVLSQFQCPYAFLVLAGKTGVGKTDQLQILKSQKEPVLDLEELAKHRGSAFGKLSESQPSQEHFENLLALALFHLNEKKFWVEDESRFVGKIRLPDSFFDQMQKAKVVLLSASLEERVGRIIRDYSSQPTSSLIQSIQQLKKSLGDESMKRAIAHLQEENYKEAVSLLLYYYDRRYERALASRDPKTVHAAENAGAVTMQNWAHLLDM